MSPDPEGNVTGAYREGFRDGALESDREHAAVEGIAEPGVYETADGMVWQDRNPGQVEKLTAELERARAERDEWRTRSNNGAARILEIARERDDANAARMLARDTALKEINEWRAKYDQTVKERDDAREIAKKLADRAVNPDEAREIQAAYDRWTPTW